MVYLLPRPAFSRSSPVSVWQRSGRTRRHHDFSPHQAIIADASRRQPPRAPLPAGVRASEQKFIGMLDEVASVKEATDCTYSWRLYHNVHEW